MQTSSIGLKEAWSPSSLMNRTVGLNATLNKFADNAKVSGVVNILERRDAIQRNLDRFLRWDHKTTCSSTRPYAKSCTWVGAIPSANMGWMIFGRRNPEEKGFQLLVNEVLDMCWQVVPAAQKANCILYQKKNGQDKGNDCPSLLWSCEIPLQYCIQDWVPRTKT